jgi:hypothetical protein
MDPPFQKLTSRLGKNAPTQLFSIDHGLTVLTRLRCLCGSLLFGLIAFPHPEALALGDDDDRVMREAVEQCGGELLVATEDLRPFGEPRGSS